MKTKLFLLFAFLACILYTQAQTPQTSYLVATIIQLKAYNGQANRIYVTETQQSYTTPSSKTANEMSVFAGTGGRRWEEEGYSSRSKYKTDSSTQAGLIGGKLDSTEAKRRIKDSINIKRIRTITASVTLYITDCTILANATSGNITITLPAAASFPTGYILNIKKIDSSGNTVTIDANASELIDEGLTYVLTAQWEGINIQTNGTAWFIL